MSAQVVNNKSCAQCECLFKKITKSMNCQLCNFWFCLECSHVTNKLYEALKSEPTKNLPFNCDGCTRILPRLTEIGAALQVQKSKIENCEKKVDGVITSMEKIVQEKVESAINEYREREERKLNVIVHNVPEPLANSENKKEEDVESLKDIFKVVKCEPVDIKEIIRLGKPGSKARLIKVKLGSLDEKHKILAGTRYLRVKHGDDYVHKWGSVFITPDQTKNERETNLKLRKELERRRIEEGNTRLVIFRGEIVERKSYAEAASSGSGLNSGLGNRVSFQL